jgi:hypothetical protein
MKRRSALVLRRFSPALNHSGHFTLAFVAVPRQDQITTLNTTCEVGNGHLFAAVCTPNIA